MKSVDESTDIYVIHMLCAENTEENETTVCITDLGMPSFLSSFPLSPVSTKPRPEN